MRSKIVFVLAIVVISLIPVMIVAPQNASSDFQCTTSSGFGSEISNNEYELDLQCQPTFPFTFEIEPDDSITITVNLTNYYAATGTDNAEFEIHLAMRRANIVIRDEGSINGEEITDSASALESISLRADGESYTFTIENQGMRSAIFDVVVRPEGM